MKVLDIILEIITAPFNLLFRSNAISNPNKPVKPIFVFLISLLITAAIMVVVAYNEGLFK